MTSTPDQLTGRISSAPSALLHELVLEPQFRFEVRHLLPHYVLIEKVLLLEYRRMGLMSEEEVRAAGQLLHQVSEEEITADPQANMSDIAFALEQYVTRRTSRPAPAWHVDRSRNDMQAGAQRLFGREMVSSCAEALLEFGRSARAVAERNADAPMPGYTHLQAAQVITPGFHLSALCGQVLRTLDRLGAVYDLVDASPLGAGAMSGQQLPWDRARMAGLLGCAGTETHALTAVASRGWALEAAAEFSVLGAALSRFVTDLMTWGSSEYGFIDLPDELSGISSAMPQKKNFPVLERIRGRTGHFTSLYFDFALVQRNTPFSNMVEVSKEAGAYQLSLFEGVRSTLALFTAVLDNLSFREDRMRAACEREYLGGFALANLLTLRCGVPWRTAQVLAGQYVVAAVERGLPPGKPDVTLLVAAAAGHGLSLSLSEAELAEVFDPDESLRGLSTQGSAHPDAVREMLAGMSTRFDGHRAQWQDRRRARQAGPAEVDRRLGLAGRSGSGLPA